MLLLLLLLWLVVVGVVVGVILQLLVFIAEADIRKCCLVLRNIDKRDVEALVFCTCSPERLN